MPALTAAAVLALTSQFNDWDPHKAAWVIYQESRNVPTAYNAAGPYTGLMQVWSGHGYTRQQLEDPAFNVQAGHAVWLKQGWAAWPVASFYTGGPDVTNVAEVTPDGWLTWAERMPGRPATGPGFTPGTNGVKGLVFHSAEGYAATLLSPTSQWGYYNAQYPWHLSNLLDGRLVQHYPFFARCWHGSAFNDNYVGMENEGLTPQGSTVGPPLNDGQVANARRVIADLSAWKGWAPRRPMSANDKMATLYEHGEVIRFGGSATQCPSKRIPWDKVLATPAEEEIMIRHNAIAQFVDPIKLTGGEVGIPLTAFVPALPDNPSLVRIEVYATQDDRANDPEFKVLDGDGRHAGFLGWGRGGNDVMGAVDVVPHGGVFKLQGVGTVLRLGVVAYWR